MRCIGDHDEFTAGVCEAFHGAFTGAYAEFRAAYDSDPKAASAVFWLPQFAESLADYAAAADALSQAIKAGKARSGDISAVVSEFVDAVHDSENVNFAALR